MIKYILSFFYHKEENSITPNSMAKMPSHKFHNYACMVLPNDDDDVSSLSQKQKYQLKRYKEHEKMEDLYDKYNH